MCRIIRPPVVVLGDDSLVVEPTMFTHELRTAARFRFAAAVDGPFNGRLNAGSRVALIERSAAGRCRVVGEGGVSVYIACSALRRISPAE